MATAIQETGLAVYGGRDEVKELGLRLRTLMPSAQNLTEAEAMAVAQIAVAHGLDPFNGEVWGLKGYDGKWYGVMVGVKGLRKSGNRQAARENTVYWKEFQYALPSEYNEPADSIVAVCILRDTATMQAYGAARKALRDSGMDNDEIKAELGPAPRFVGIGIASPSEKSKMKLHARATKRAEADALKKRFDVEFGAGVITEGEKMDAEVMQIVENLAPDEAGTDLERLPAPQSEQHDTQQTIDELFPSTSLDTPAKSLSGVKTKLVPRPEQPVAEITSTEYYKKAKSLGLETEDAAAILSECDGDFKTAYARMVEQHESPTA